MSEQNSNPAPSAADLNADDPNAASNSKSEPATDRPYEPEYVVQQDFVYAQKVGRKNDGGIYLDDVQRQQAEIHRAKLEGRKPDLKNPGSTAGTPLYPMQTIAASVPKDVVVKADVTLPVSVASEAEIAEIKAHNAKGDN